MADIFVREMVKEAIEALGGRASRKELREYILTKYPNTAENTVNTQIGVLVVNMKSRIHYPENSSPRICTDERYDLLYTVGRGQFVSYDPEKHGKWAIVDKDGGLKVEQVDVEEEYPLEREDESNDDVETSSFVLEAHLRDYLAQNLQTVSPDLQLYMDDNGRKGIEYPTQVGYIDILASDSSDNFVVFELKVSRGSDSTCGQILRYMGWVRHKLAKGRDVKGIIVASSISDKLKYAASEHPKLDLYEYALSFDLQPVDISAL